VRRSEALDRHFAGEECFVALDLASNVDIAAEVLFRRLVDERTKTASSSRTRTTTPSAGSICPKTSSRNRQQPVQGLGERPAT
jgi:hypothetical protein